jgi:hypothetical protein
MAEFLNTKKIRDYIEKIIETAERELVIISPYLQIDEYLINLLKNADARGVETTLVYKEQKVNDAERNKLKQIDNLNLLHHPNIHCKTYYNEKYLIITSMNLFDYSKRNNREMGVLFRRTNEDSTGWNDYKNKKDDESIFQDAIAEIKSIINSSEFEKDSRETKTIGFEMDIIKTKYDLIVEKCNNYNKFSKNKKFIPFQSGEDWYCKCENFLDHVDLVFDGNRAVIDINFDENRLSQLFQQLSTKKYENDYRAIGCFRMFWTYHKSSIYLYELKGHRVWQKENEDFYSSFFNGLNEVFKTIKPVIEARKK